MLSLIVFLPLLTVPLILSAPRKAFWFSLTGTLIQSALVIFFIGQFDDHWYHPSSDSINNIYTERYEWIRTQMGSWGTFKADYHLAADGLNILMVLLCALILPVTVGASYPLKERRSAYYALLALLNTSLYGSFLAQDFFLFYLFYELMLIPMFFLIGIWGGENRLYASIKFFLYTLFGSVFMLLVMVGLHFSYQDVSGGSKEILHTFDFSVLSDPKALIPNSFFANSVVRFWGFAGLFLAFAVKLPLVPVHTWLPDAHVQASSPVSILLAALLLKVGGYGLIRVCWGIFPEQALAYAPVLAGLAVVSVLYGGLNALAQTDYKRMIAYSSIAHMGFVLLGLSSFTATGMTGAMYQMFTHGLITSMLFLSAGVLHDRVHSYRIDHFKGLLTGMPVYSLFVFTAFFAGMGLPGLPAFVSELLVFTGGFQSEYISPYWVVASVFGILLSAGYFIKTIKNMFLGQYEVFGGEIWKQSLTDLNIREKILFSVLLFIVLWSGLYPQTFLQLTDDSCADFIAFLQNLNSGKALK